MQLLRKETAVIVPIGPVVDAADGFTPETTLDLTLADLAAVEKHGSGVHTSISNNTFAHVAQGCYKLTLDPGDVDTLGCLDVLIVDTSLCRPIRDRFEIVPADVYDALVAGSLPLQADVRRINNDASSAAKQAAALLGVITGACVSGSSTTAVKTNLTQANDDHFNGRTIVFTSGALAGQGATITDYSGASKTLTVAGLTAAPASGDTFVIV